MESAQPIVLAQERQIDDDNAELKKQSGHLGAVSLNSRSAHDPRRSRLPLRRKRASRPQVRGRRARMDSGVCLTSRQRDFGTENCCCWGLGHVQTIVSILPKGPGATLEDMCQARSREEGAPRRLKTCDAGAAIIRNLHTATDRHCETHSADAGLRSTMSPGAFPRDSVKFLSTSIFEVHRPITQRHAGSLISRTRNVKNVPTCTQLASDGLVDCVPQRSRPAGVACSTAGVPGQGCFGEVEPVIRAQRA